MKTTYRLLACLLLILFCSCEKIVEFDPGEVEPHVVMISRPVTDSLVSVHMSYSRFFLDGHTPSAVSNAQINMTVNGVPVSVSNEGDGEYLLNVRPQPGDSLDIKATVPGYDRTLHASTVVPPRPVIQLVDYFIDTTSNYDYGMVYYRLRFKVIDPSHNSYYGIGLDAADVGMHFYDSTNYYTHYDSVWWDTTNWVSQWFTIDDPIVNNSSDADDLFDFSGDTYGDETLFSTDGFTNGEHMFTIDFETYQSYSGMMLNYRKRPVRLVLRRLSPELYRYTVTAVTVSTFNQLFSEPVQIICNVDGGIGIFGASSCEVKRLPVPRYNHFHQDSESNWKK